MGKFIEIKLAR